MVAVCIRRIVQPLESEPAADGGVTYYSNHMAGRFLLFQRACRSHAERRGDRVGSVSCRKGVILALIRVGKPADAAELAVCVKPLCPACKQLMPVCLMTYIPDNTVVGGIENIVKRHCQLNHAHA